MVRRFRPLAKEIRGTVKSRFFAKVHKTESCWIWRGYVMPNGYGHLGIRRGLHAYAHRLSYVIAKGEIPEGLDIDHLCRNRACVNPDHLEAVSRRVNLLRGSTLVAAFVVRDRCKYGHSYDTKNTHMYRGYRDCRECHKNREQARRDRLKVAA